MPIGRFFKFYGGLGTNLGYNFANNMYIYGSTIDKTAEELSYLNVGETTNDISSPSYEYFDDYYVTSNGFSQRLFGQAGFGIIILRRFELGFDLRYGIGYRYLQDAELKRTKLNSWGFNLKYAF